MIYQQLQKQEVYTPRGVMRKSLAGVDMLIEEYGAIMFLKNKGRYTKHKEDHWRQEYIRQWKNFSSDDRAKLARFLRQQGVVVGV
jgi:hypothetical protein